MPARRASHAPDVPTGGIMAGGGENRCFRRVASGAAARPAAFLAIVTFFACCAMAAPISAQQNAPVNPSQDFGHGGESATVPTADFTARERLWIVGAASMQPITDTVVAHLMYDYVLPQPIVELGGTRAGIKAFCNGIGPQYPDIVAASDRMTSGELNRCLKNNVLDVIEVSIGLSALVVVTRKGNPVFNVTARMFYQALAEQIPIEGEFTANPHKSWKDTATDAPDLPIHVILPTRRTGTRSSFDDHFMQSGCRHVKEIDKIFAAAERVPLCTTLRKDGVFSEAVETATGDDFVGALAQSAPGTVAILPREVFLRVQDKVDALPVAGMLPTKANVANFDYEMFEFLRYYFKRGHMRDNSGHGVVRGIREFMAEIVKDEAFSDSGYFERLGVVPLAPEWRDNQQKIVRRLKNFQP